MSFNNSGSRSTDKLNLLTEVAKRAIESRPELMERLKSVSIDWKPMPNGEYAPVVKVDFNDPIE
jgi:hypothetical protein